MDRRTQQATGERLCPARAWARVVQRVLATIGGADKLTPTFQVGDSEGNTILISSKRVTMLIRLNCEVDGQRPREGLRLRSKRPGHQVHPLGHSNGSLGAVVLRWIYGLHPPTGAGVDQHHVQGPGPSRQLPGPWLPIQRACHHPSRQEPPPQTGAHPPILPRKVVWFRGRTDTGNTRLGLPRPGGEIAIQESQKNFY
jgi:hypothetical protein